MSDLLDDILPIEPQRIEIADQGRHASLQWLAGDERLLTDLLVELRGYRATRTPSSNGQGYEVACFGCHAKFTVKRRPTPGRRAWCETCKSNGEPAAQRARDYRARKEENSHNGD